MGGNAHEAARASTRTLDNSNWRISYLVSRAKRTSRRLGWAYVAYHVLTAAMLVALSFQHLNPGYWRRTEFQLELLFVVLIYPALIPALFVCGGLHDHCTTVLGHAVQVTVFLATVACYVMGSWVLASLMVRRFRRATEARRGG